MKEASSSVNGPSTTVNHCVCGTFGVVRLDLHDGLQVMCIQCGTLLNHIPAGHDSALDRRFGNPETALAFEAMVVAAPSLLML